MRFLMCVLICPQLLWAQVIQHEKDITYDVTGNSVSSLRQSMIDKGLLDHGRKVDANTHWDIRFHYYYLRHSGTCRLADIKVNLKISYQLPHWQNQNQGKMELQKKWDDYIAHLAIHEKGHGAHGKQAAAEIDKMLAALPAMTDCNMLNTTANIKAKQIIKKYNAVDIEYDKDTHHGASQGAIFK